MPQKRNKHELYDTTEGVSRKNKICPRCGPGIFLAKHADRESCGACGYTEFPNKPKEDESPKEQAPEAIEGREEKAPDKKEEGPVEEAKEAPKEE
ncbi:TPA: 30S ribosomal protein S27ae [archaeon]|nr:30S ribosomal protein S27ae [Candidatus Undinarchaeales archaeon SRR5007147.bin71]